MAGEWIKMRTNLWDDPRVSQLCDLTDATEATVVGALYWLWAAADEHTESGHMPGLSISGIDRKTGIKGIGAALVAIRWIEDTEGGITINRFSEHNGTSAKNRVQTAKRVANKRSNAHVTPESNNSGNTTVTGALPREEKRREELTSNPTTPDGVVVASEAGNPPARGPERAARSECPHQEIIALYHEILPECPQVRDWTPARSVQLRARWNEDPRRQNLDYWRQFFDYVKGCGFLVGRGTGNGNRPFFADLEWLTKSKNFTKVREGKYE
jgi:hypothetical protein